jgi:RHS repeat-associated protein
VSYDELQTPGSPWQDLMDVDYAYDVAGNRTADSGGSYTYDDLNRMLTSPGFSYTNDIVGNRTQRTGGATINYTWDVLNRLIQYTPQTFPYNPIKMGYRGDGMRVWKMGQWLQQAPGRREGGGLDQGSIIEGRWAYKYDGQMMVQQTYQWRSPSPIQHTQFVPGMRGVECRMKPDLSVDWFVYDAHGNVVATVDGLGQGQAWGEVRNVRKFDVWGSQRGDTVKPATPADHAYCGNLGHTQDDELGGLIYMRARYYEPWTGRFVSEDPAKDGGNWFCYADSDPVGLVDSGGDLAEEFYLGLIFGYFSALTLAALQGHGPGATIEAVPRGLIGGAVGYLVNWLITYAGVKEVKYFRGRDGAKLIGKKAVRKLAVVGGFLEGLAEFGCQAISGWIAAQSMRAGEALFWMFLIDNPDIRL